LMSPTPTRTRPEPTDTDPILPPVHRPPHIIEVETVYSADISHATLPAHHNRTSSVHNGPFVSVKNSSRPTWPLPAPPNHVSHVAPTNAVAPTTRQYSPATMPTPWSAAARAAAPYPIQQSPPTIYAPNTFGTPGFQPVCSPVPAPTMVSSGLDIMSQPRLPSHGFHSCPRPRVPKHNRGNTTVDIEKLVG
jgi:hypothetical protein